MKVCRSQSASAKKGRAAVARHVPAPAAQGADLFDALDLFLTGLILDRAPAGARTGLTGWLAENERPPVRTRPRAKRKALAPSAS